MFIKRGSLLSSIKAVFYAKPILVVFESTHLGYTRSKYPKQQTNSESAFCHNMPS
jgi:hypothetical protein